MSTFHSLLQVLVLLGGIYPSARHTVLNLRPTLSSAVSDVVGLSEEEPYGIRGARIFVKLREAQAATSSTTPSSSPGTVVSAEENINVGLKHLGVIDVDQHTVTKKKKIYLKLSWSCIDEEDLLVFFCEFLKSYWR